ncbi:MAG: hypothetical protein NT099_09045 [Candidatus Saganbacteria bacterium]|nr:hypothetical protein [Candidatus Saganbacteria bacterium]
MKKILCGFWIITFLLLNVSSAFACWGFRPMGMGGTFVAVADDANLAYWNRAGIGQMDNWTNGESQIVVTDTVQNQNGYFNREAGLGNTYYDSFNYAMKINKNFGWSLAGEWSGGSAYALSPSIGFRLPWNEQMSLGIGYFYFKSQNYADPLSTGTNVLVDSVQNQIHLDFLWRFHKEWSFGIHCENFWALSGNETSPDIPGWKQDYESSLWNDVNFRPSIAWMPEGRLKGLVVNAGLYDAFSKFGGPFSSLGFEYTPQPAPIATTQTNENVVPKETFWTRSSFRAGVYNYKSNNEGATTLGYGYKINDRLDIGYFGLFWLAGTGFDHNIGVAYKF